MPGWTRASELDRTLYCAGSKTIPAARIVSEGVAKAGAWGTFVHHWKETGELLKESDFYDSFKKTFDKKWEIIGNPEFRENLWPSSGEHETTYSYSCETGTVGRLDSKLDVATWKELCSSEWVCGTNDYEGEIEGLLWVDDLKTGAMFDTPPDKCYQLYFYAMCASLFKYGEIRDTVVSITKWPKYPLSVLPERTFGYLTVKRIEKFKTLLVYRYNEWLEGVNVESFNAGEWCQWCPVGESGKCPIT